MKKRFPARLNLFVPDEMYQSLEDLAQRQGQTIASITRGAILAVLNRDAGRRRFLSAQNTGVIDERQSG